MRKQTVMVAITIVIVIAIVVFINSNKRKDPITASSFDNTMSQKGYIVQDATSQFSDYDYVKQAYDAANEDCSCQISFYEIVDDSYAESFYNYSKSGFELLRKNGSVETSKESKHYSKYTLLSGGEYKVVSRIGNTIIYVDSVDDEYKETIEDILDELGY